jgi:lysophospholipase L1-like esterase
MIIEGTYIYSSSDYIPFQQEIIPFKMPQGVFKSKWYGKTWWVLGDSISTGQGSGAPASMQPYSTAPYHYLLANERFIKVQNEAVSGYTIGNIYNNKVVNMPPTTYAPDLITIMAGTNDHGFQTTIGTIDDATSSTTFYGTYKKTVEFLLDRFPKAAIGLITPIQRYNATYDGKVARGGATLRGFSDAVINIAKYYSIPYLDLYDTVGFTPYRTTSLNNFYCLDGSNVPDGTHPNNLGHTFMKSRVGNFIESI